MSISRSHITFAVSSVGLASTIAGAAFTTNTVSTPKVASVIAQTFADESGLNSTATPTGTVGTNNPFFTPLGSNGRACVTCHQPSSGWSVTPANIQARFAATGGTDPIFRTNDGSNSPNANVSTVAARQEAYSMLLTKGLFRIGIGVPANAEFTLVGDDDPYGYASAAQLSLFRRPLPSQNLAFLTAVMFDGRETIAGDTITQDLESQASDAITGHEQGAVPSAATLASIVSFESGLTQAQSLDNQAGSLSASGATGGPVALSTQPFYVGINDVAGGDPTGAKFSPNVFTVYNSWAASISTANVIAAIAPPPPPPAPGKPGGGAPPPPPPPAKPAPPTAQTLAQQSIARGEAIFNTRPFQITNVGGLNDVAGAPSITGTCSSCHDTPNVGNHSVETFLNIGTSAAVLATPDLPLYTFKNNTTGATIATTDPGRALITGKWADIGKFKVPTLRGLASRAPYFHDGFAPSAQAVVGFYNNRFNIGLSAQDQTDLANFLQSL